MRAVRQRIAQTDWSRFVSNATDERQYPADDQLIEVRFCLPERDSIAENRVVSVEILNAEIALSTADPRVHSEGGVTVLAIYRNPLVYVDQLTEGGRIFTVSISIAVPADVSEEGDLPELIAPLLALFPASIRDQVRAFTERPAREVSKASKVFKLSWEELRELIGNIRASVPDPTVWAVLT